MNEAVIIYRPEGTPEQTLYGDLGPEELAAIVHRAETADAGDHILSVPLRITPDGPTYHRLLDASRIVAVNEHQIERRP